jgi:hypothetical protein
MIDMEIDELSKLLRVLLEQLEPKKRHCFGVE